MKRKPTITLSKDTGDYLKDGIAISNQEARQLWDDGSCDWSQAAFQKMAKEVMS